MTACAPERDELVEIEPGLTVPRFVLNWSRSAPDEARRLVDRLPDVVQLPDNSVLAVGRGAADLGIELARRRARRVVAMDMAKGRMELARRRLAGEALTPVVEIRPYGRGLRELGDERFGVLLAVDAFRRYGADRSSRHVEELVLEMSSRLEAGGHLAIRFGPPWKAPYGGGVDSRLPWAHLLFPEPVIFDEFRRVRHGNHARTFDDVGVNRITLDRFRRAMQATGLECVHFERNVSDRRAMAIANVICRVLPVDEYLTQNVYGVWRRTTAGGAK